MHGCSYFYAKAARMKVAADGLEGGRAMRQVEEGTTKIQLERKMGTEHTAAMLRAKRSTRTFVVCTCRLLHLLHRSLYFSVSYLLKFISLVLSCFIVFRLQYVQPSLDTAASLYREKTVTCS